MDWLRHFDSEKLLLLTLVLTRVSGLMMTAPIYGGSDAPMQVRALLAFALAVLVMPSQWGVHVADPGTHALLPGLHRRRAAWSARAWGWESPSSSPASRWPAT